MFNRAELKAIAKHRLQNNWGYMAGLMVIVLLINFISTFALGFIPVIGFLLSMAVSIPISFSQIIMSAKLYEGEAVLVNDIFSGFQYFWKCIGLALWVALWTMLWSFLFVIPGIIKSYSYSFALPCLLSNSELTIREALKESIRLTNSNKAELFVLDLSWIGWSFLSVFTCGIGSLFLSPYMNLTHYAAYRFVKDKKDGNDEDTEF